MPALTNNTQEPRWAGHRRWAAWLALTLVVGCSEPPAERAVWIDAVDDPAMASAVAGRAPVVPAADTSVAGERVSSSGAQGGAASAVEPTRYAVADPAMAARDLSDQQDLSQEDLSQEDLSQEGLSQEGLSQVSTGIERVAGAAAEASLASPPVLAPGELGTPDGVRVDPVTGQVFLPGAGWLAPADFVHLYEHEPERLPPGVDFQTLHRIREGLSNRG